MRPKYSPRGIILEWPDVIRFDTSKEQKKVNEFQIGGNNAVLITLSLTVGEKGELLVYGSIRSLALSLLSNLFIFFIATNSFKKEKGQKKGR